MHWHGNQTLPHRARKKLSSKSSLHPRDETRSVNSVLFISIRQIIDHIFASENKVSEATFSNFSEISPKSRNFAGTENVLKKREIGIHPRHLETVTKI